jgi:hypothetical protein
MTGVERSCALLIASGWVRRNDIRELEHPQIRSEVEARLRSCGLSLATSAYSEYYGLRLVSEVCDATVLDTPTNMDLGRDACALLTVLWARLALQKRTAGDTHDTPVMQVSLLPQQRAEQARAYSPSVRFETLVQEFGSSFGGRTRLRSLLSRLRRLGFIIYHHLDDIQAGPLLELGIDGEKMIAFIRSRVLGELLARSQPLASSQEVAKQRAQSERPPDVAQVSPTGTDSKPVTGVS